jgi:hypothetical protein
MRSSLRVHQPLSVNHSARETENAAALIGSFFVDRKIITSHEMERIVEQFHTHNRKYWHT